MDLPGDFFTRASLLTFGGAPAATFVVPNALQAAFGVTGLETGIRKWITQWNMNPKPFVWTKSANEILKTLATYCQRIIDSGH